MYIKKLENINIHLKIVEIRKMFSCEIKCNIFIPLIM